MKLLRRLAESLLAGGRPWILAGDWNVLPQALIYTGFVANRRPVKVTAAQHQ